MKSIFVKWPPELEIGGTYRRRDGREEKITQHVPASGFPYRTSTGEGYLPNGRYLGGCSDSYHDIVEVAKQQTLEVGRWYRTNDGDVVQCTYADDPHYTASSWGYRSNGLWCGQEADPDYPRHLVEEVDAPAPKLQLEVGKMYRAADGELVVIVKNDGDDSYPFDGDNNGSYTPKGSAIFDGCELVEEVETEGAFTTINSAGNFATHLFRDRDTLRRARARCRLDPDQCGQAFMNAVTHGLFLRPRDDIDLSHTKFFSRDQIIEMFSGENTDEVAA